MGLIRDAFWASRFDNPALGAKLVEGKTYASLFADSVSGTLKSVTGNPISVSDAKAGKAKSLTVGFSPKQDLNGYSNPWPGGGGKNLFTTDGATEGQYIKAAGGTGTSDSWHASDYISVVPSTEYTFNPNSNAGNAAYHAYYDADKAFISAIESGQQTFTTPANCRYMRFSYRAESTDIQLELGSAATAYSPYSNICPISGWQSVNLWRTGVNMWDEEWELGVYATSTGNPIVSDSSIRSKSTNYISVAPSTAYYFNTAGYVMEVYQYRADKSYIGKLFNATNNVYTTHAECHYIRFDLGQSYGTTYNHDVSINFPATQTSYVASKGIDSRTISLPSTIYGGTVECVSGVGSSTYGYVDLGSLSWVYVTSSDEPYFRASNASVGAKAGTTNAVCSQYAVVANQNGGDCTIWVSSTGNYLFVRDNRFDNADDFTTAMDGVMFCYELADPTSFTISPQDITLLAGDNVLWTDADSITMQYKAST